TDVYGSSGGTGELDLRNSIVHDTPEQGLDPIDLLSRSGGVITADYSNFRTVNDESGGTITAPGSAHNIAAEPQLDGFQPADSSPLIDRGDPSIVTPGELDLEGSPRAFDSNGDGIAVPDIGAVEWIGCRTACPAPPPPGGSAQDPAPVISGFGMTNRKLKPA